MNYLIKVTCDYNDGDCVESSVIIKENDVNLKNYLFAACKLQEILQLNPSIGNFNTNIYDGYYRNRSKDTFDVVYSDILTEIDINHIYDILPTVEYCEFHTLCDVGVYLISEKIDDIASHFKNKYK